MKDNLACHKIDKKSHLFVNKVQVCNIMLVSIHWGARLPKGAGINYNVCFSLKQDATRSNIH